MSLCLLRFASIQPRNDRPKLKTEWNPFDFRLRAPAESLDCLRLRLLKHKLRELCNAHLVEMSRGSRQKRRESEVTAANEQIRELSLKPSKDAERIRELEKEVLFFYSSKNILKNFAVNMNGFHF